MPSIQVFIICIKRCKSKVLGQADFVRGFRQVKTYTAWMIPVGKSVVLKGQTIADKKMLKMKSTTGELEEITKTIGVNANVLKKKNGKAKKKISDRDLQTMAGTINRRIMASTMKNVNLAVMTDKQLKAVKKQLSGKDRELLETFIKIKSIRDTRKNKSKAGRKKVQSLTGLFSTSIRDADVYQGYKLCEKYTATAVRTIRKVKITALKTKRGAQWIARKMVRPYDAKLKKREMEKFRHSEAKRMKKEHKCKIKRKKKMNKIARRKEALKKAGNKAVKKVTGRTATSWKKTVSNSRAGKMANRARGKLSHVNKIRKKTSGTMAKMFGKVFSIFGKMFSLPGLIKHFIMYCIGIFVISILVVLLAITPVVAVLDIIPDFSISDDTGEENMDKFEYVKVRDKGITLASLSDDLANGKFELYTAESGERYEKVYNGTSYWLTYCDDMSKYGSDNEAGYFLVPKTDDSILAPSASPDPLATSAPMIVPPNGVNISPSIPTVGPTDSGKDNEEPEGIKVNTIAGNGTNAYWFYSDK